MKRKIKIALYLSASIVSAYFLQKMVGIRFVDITNAFLELPHAMKVLFVWVCFVLAITGFMFELNRPD